MGSGSQSYDDFDRVDIRIGKVTRAGSFTGARKPACKLTIDFGPEIGIKRASAQLTRPYALNDLVSVDRARPDGEKLF